MTLKTAGAGMDSADALKELIARQAVEIGHLKRGRDLALKRMQESNMYCIELRERLNKYEPGAAMILNAAIQKETP